jgi:rod shape-determining protein MreD
MTGAVVIVAAVLAQVMLVNRLPLPAGGAPDLVLLAVVGVAVLRGPAAGSPPWCCACCSRPCWPRRSAGCSPTRG